MKYSESLENVLGLSEEPYLAIKDSQVHDLLTEHPDEFLDYAYTRLRAIAAGRVSLDQPAKTLFNDSEEDGDFRVMPCVTRHGDDVVKTVKIVGTNIRQETVPGQITVGKAFAIDPIENFITHVFDACLLSSARTGLCAALGIKLLAKQSSHIVLVGCGRVGFYSLLYANSISPLTRVDLVDVDAMRAENLAKALAEVLPNVSVSCIDSSSFDGDVLILATSSREVISTPNNTRVDLIVSLGADTDDQQELSHLWAEQSDLFVDTPDTLNYGDLKKWQSEGLIDRKQIADLFKLLSDEAQIPRLMQSSRQKLYVSTGSALFDNLAIGYLLKHL